MEYKIYVGTVVTIKKGFLEAAFKIMYCGMTNDCVFALSPFVTSGYQGLSPNIYYKIDSTVIQVFDQTFNVIKVTSECIVIGD